jgi:dTDP-D-glucose 4,6-dehydratase
MAKYLVTGIKSGLGKYLYENLPDAHGLDRGGFNLIKDEEYDTIIHCAFNKENVITDYKKYLDLSYSRPGQDVRYALNDNKLRALGWKPQMEFDKMLPDIVEYYRNKFI